MALNQAQAMKQVQRAQAEMARVQEELKSDLVTASAGGGAVKVSITGDLTVTDVVIDPRAVDPEDVAMLQDMVVAAVNEALRRLRADAGKALELLEQTGYRLRVVGHG